ncbi:MAG TPA: TadE/TadG family type IV pilus assembly protein [Acidimicrobiia bacterium]|nr:TadE/TadG family type IV pilus assembly protein [Acidimicrobiia bacterium]
MVEMAFIFSILVMLLVGVVTSAIAFAQKNSIENSAREASRYAATYPGPVDSAWLDTVRDVARSAAQGSLDAGVDGQYICVAHTGSGQKLEDTNGTTSVTSGTCYNDGLSDSRVQIVTRRDSQISAAFFSVDVTLNAPATARYEREE